MSAPQQQRGADGWREPAGRHYHSTAVAGDHLCLCAGHQDGMPEVHDSAEKRQFFSSVEVFDVNTGCWEQRTTNGTPPLGVWGYSCVAVRNELHYFGGHCGHGGCYHNSVHTLSTSTLQWRMLALSTTEDGAPMQKSCCGMVHFTDGEEDLLYVVGGKGRAVPSSPQHGAQYQKYGDGVFTNEQHIFSLSTNDGWSSPVVTGQAPPPCYHFTLTTVEGKRAAMFGGTTPSSYSSVDLYIVDLERHSVNWIKIKKPVSQSVQWPVGRRGHAASHITGPVFVISGGYDVGSTLSDIWLYDTNQWIKLPTLPDSVTRRDYHSVSVLHLGAHCVWILVFGGLPHKAGTSIIELIQDTSGQWCVERVMERETLSNNTEYQKRLREARIKGVLGDRANTMMEELMIVSRQLQQQLQESEQSYQRRISEVEEEVRVLRLQVQDQQHETNIDERDEKQDKHESHNETEPQTSETSLELTSEDVIRAYEDSLRLSKKREQELMEKLDAAQRDSQEKDLKCSKLEDDMYDMQKKMAAGRDDYEQQQELLEKLQQKKSTLQTPAEPQTPVKGTKPEAYSQAPSIPKLMTLVAKKIPTKWYDIGIQLEIEISTLEAFEQQTSDQKRLYSKVFDQWRKEQKVPFTWETIIDTLKEADENSTAAGIREWLDTRT